MVVMLTPTIPPPLTQIKIGSPHSIARLGGQTSSGSATIGRILLGSTDLAGLVDNVTSATIGRILLGVTELAGQMDNEAGNGRTLLGVMLKKQDLAEVITGKAGIGRILHGSTDPAGQMDNVTLITIGVILLGGGTAGPLASILSILIEAGIGAILLGIILLRHHLAEVITGKAGIGHSFLHLWGWIPAGDGSTDPAGLMDKLDLITTG